MTIGKHFRLFKKYLLNAKPASGPSRQTDFEMHLEPFDIDDYTQSLHSPFFRREIVHEIAYQDHQYQIVQLSYSPSTAKKRLLIIAGVHGNEFAAALAVSELLHDVTANPGLYEQWNIRIIAPVNPVGLAYGSRYNEDGYDINRDFEHFRTAGARTQRDAIASFRPDFIVSLHESPQDGFFMFSEGKLPKSVRKKLLMELTDAGVTLSAKNYLAIATKQGIWEKTAPVYIVQRLLGIHTLGSYARKLGIPMITTESCWKGTDVAARQKPHVVVVRAIVGGYPLTTES